MARNFKTACTDTENCIFPYVNSGSGTVVDLREIYLKERQKDHLKDISEYEKICRLCMQVIISSFTTLKEINVDTLRLYIPEVVSTGFVIRSKFTQFMIIIDFFSCRISISPQNPLYVKLASIHWTLIRGS